MRRWVVQTPKMGVIKLILGVNMLVVSTPPETGVNTGVTSPHLLGAVFNTRCVNTVLTLTRRPCLSLSLSFLFIHLLRQVLIQA